VPSESLAIDEKRELVARVADSAAFQKSPRLRAFLIYVADCTLNNRLEDARELQIAQHVFHRKPGYNPGQDNIVRVEARSLRKRLEVYFATEGKDEQTILCMPKGSYIISFEPRSQQDSETPEEANAPAAGPSPRRLRLLLFIAVVLACLLVLQWYFYRRARPGQPTRPRTLPFSALMDGTRDTYIVTSDTALIIIQELAGRQLSLDEYINRRYPDELAHVDPVRLELIRRMQTRQYTNAAEVRVATEMMSLKGASSRPVLLRYSREMQLPDFKDRNVILLGSPIANPWVSLLGKTLDFQFGIDDKWRGLIRNMKPRAGEQAVYAMTTRSGETGEAYAVVAFVPNLTGQGSVLLIAGTTGEGTQAAGEFISDEVRSSKALQGIGIDPAGPLRYFEILLKVQTVAGSPSQSAVLATRVIPGSNR
jgi:hypothetical protein